MVRPGGDSRLQQILQKRLLCSEGAESNHCYTKEAAQGSADAMAEVAHSPESEGKRFSLDASDTPPLTPKTSPPCIDACKPEEEAESTDGLPEHPETEGDLHYDWQFELMNSMPREKALELARVLKRSEQEKAKESQKLRQEVVELKRQVTRQREEPRRSSPACPWILAVLLLLPALAVPAWPLLRPVPGAANVSPTPDAKEAPPAPTLEALPPKVLKTEVGVSAHAFPTVPSAAPRHLGAEVLGRVGTERWHASLTEDETAVGPVTQAIQANLKAVMQIFPKVTQAYCFTKLMVSKAKLDGRQVALEASLQVLNSGVGAWPERTMLKLIHGVGMGLPSLTVGQTVLPGQHIDLSLQLEVPNRGQGDGTSSMRSMWVLVDGFDEPFGPLLVAEVHYVD